MGDAYTGSGQMEFDRRDREEAANKTERAEKLIAKSKDNKRFNSLVKSYNKIEHEIIKKEKAHEKELEKMRAKSWKIIQSIDKIRDKYE